MADKKDDKKRKPLAGAGGFLLLAGLAICVGVFLFGGARRKQQSDDNKTASSPWAGTATPATPGRVCTLNEEGDVIGDCTYVDPKTSSDTHVRWQGVGIDGWQNLEWGSGQCEWYVDGTKVPRACSMEKTGPRNFRFMIPRRSGGVTHLGVELGGPSAEPGTTVFTR